MTFIRRIPAHVLFMLVLTALYLSVEVPFTVYLNLFMSGAASAEAMQSVEKFGRILTGTAVALAIIGLVVPRYVNERTPFALGAAAALAYGLIAVTGVYFGLDFYAQTTTDRASPQDMQQAYKSVLARSYIAHNGIAGVKPDNSNPAWRSMLATVAVAVDHSKFQAEAAQDFAQIAEAEAARQIGSQSQFRGHFFAQAMAPVRSAYETYAKGSQEFGKRIASVNDEGEREWRSYVDELRSRFPNGLPQQGYAVGEIRRNVQTRLPVADDWSITDKRSFMATYRQVAVRQIKTAYIDRMQFALGGDAYLKPGLSFGQFAAQPVIQNRIREQIERDYGFRIKGVGSGMGRNDTLSARQAASALRIGHSGTSSPEHCEIIVTSTASMRWRSAILARTSARCGSVRRCTSAQVWLLQSTR